MMKYLLVILILLVSFTGKAQQRFPTGFPTQFNTGFNKWGYAMTDSGLIVANRDTTWLAKYSGTVVFRPANKKFYWFDSTTLRWNVFADAIDTTSLSNRINLKLNISDTTNKWWGVGKRWVDSMYRVNDSTVGYTINGDAYTFQILGRLPSGGGGSGTVTSVGLSMPSAFNVTPSSITTSGTFAVSGAGTSLQYIRGNGTLATFDTTAIPNFYLKVRGLISGTSPITFSQTTGAIGITNANTSGTKGAATFNSADFSDNGSGTISLANVISAGSCNNCNLTYDAKGRLITATSGSGGGGSIDTAVNVGTGVGVFKETTGDTLNFKSITEGWGVNITNNPSDLQLGVDSSEVASRYDLSLVNNGLSRVADTTQWGGALVKHTTIDGGVNYESRFTGATPVGSGLYTMTVKNTALFGNALRAEGVDGGIGIEAVSSTGYAANVTSGSGVALQASTGANTAIIANVNPSSTNTIHQIVDLIRGSSGTPANNMGLSLDFDIETSVQVRPANQLVSKFTTIADASRTSQFEIWGVNNAVLARKAALAGSGQWTWDGYPALSAQTDTTTYKPVAIDGSGNVVKMGGWPSGGSAGIQQTLTIGDTTLRQIIWRDTASASGTNSLLLTTVVPSNHDTVYTNGEGGLFQSSIAKFTGVNVDGRPNVVGNFWSYNATSVGGRINLNEAAFRFGTETHYQLGVGQNPAFEFHLPEVTTQSGTSFRPFSMYILKNSGLTNTDMQITQMSWLKQLDGNVAWGRFSYGNDGTIFNQISESNSQRNQHLFTLPGSIGGLAYDSTGFQLTSSLTGTKIFSTNMSIQYGSPSNFSGMDGYGNVTWREGKNLILNTSTRTIFADWQHDFVQSFYFDKDLAVFREPLLMASPLQMLLGNAIMSTNGDPLQLNSSGGTGSDIRIVNGQSGARIMTMFHALGVGADGVNTNVNIGPATANPGYRLKVQGSAYIDTNLYVARHTIAANSDSAVVWNRANNRYEYAKINGASGITTLNTLTAATQTFATGTTGTDFNINSTTSTHTFNIPDASTTARGLVTTGAQSFAGDKTFTTGAITTQPSASQTPTLVMNGNRSVGAAPGISGIGFSVSAINYTNTAAAGTETQGQNFNLITAPTLTSSNAITYTGDVATFRSTGAPIAGGSSTIEHPYNILANDVSKFSGIAMALNEQAADATIGAASGVNIYTGSGGNAWTLPALAAHPGKFILIKNAGSGNLTVQRGGSDNIYTTTSVTSFTVAAGADVVIAAGSSFWYVLGL